MLFSLLCDLFGIFLRITLFIGGLILKFIWIAFIAALIISFIIYVKWRDKNEN